MKKDVVLSLCIPTNGNLDWMKQVVDSIYNDDYDVNAFEVIVTDNGDNDEFNKYMKLCGLKYSNLKYYKTDSYQFLNQIDAFKFANGQLIKFINHRMPVKKGTIEYLVNFAEKYKNEKPAIYFTNGVLKSKNKIIEISSFDLYVRTLTYWSSWSAGTAMWKSDFDKIDCNKEFNVMFPHTDLVFGERQKSKYVIDDNFLFDDIDPTASQKGKYDLFDTFAVKYIDILNEMHLRGDITKNTLEKIKKDNLLFVMSLYTSYVLLQRPCSYDLNSFDKSINVYYKKSLAYLYLIKYCFHTVLQLLGAKIKNEKS